jgi:hypothetical protein
MLSPIALSKSNSATNSRNRDHFAHFSIVLRVSQLIGHVIKCVLGRVLVSHIHPPYLYVTYHSINELATPYLISSAMCVAERDLKRSRIVALDLWRDEVIAGVLVETVG